MASRAAVGKALLVINAIATDAISKEAIPVWLAALEPLGDELLEAATILWARTSRHARRPSPGDLFYAAQEIVKRHITPAGEAWHRIKQAVEQAGYTGAGWVGNWDAWKQLTGLEQTAAKRVGLAVIAMETESGFTRNAFNTVYDELVAHCVTPGNVTEAFQALREQNIIGPGEGLEALEAEHAG